MLCETGTDLIDRMITMFEMIVIPRHHIRQVIPFLLLPFGQLVVRLGR